MVMLEKEEEIKNILNILKNTKKAIKTEDTLLLRDMSNRTIHSASIYKDPASVVIAVTVYALSKIVERKKYVHYKNWPVFFSRVTKDIDKAIEHLKKKKFDAFHKDTEDIRKAVSSLGEELKLYIKDVFRKAQINKASKLYEHGISRAETAKLLSITQWELAEYVGKSGISDISLNLTKSIKERIKFASSLFES